MATFLINEDRESSYLISSGVLKVCLGAHIFGKEVKVNTSKDEFDQCFVEPERDLKLFDANAIVRYFGKYFEKDEVLGEEESKIYRALKSNNREKILEAIESSNVPFRRAEPTVSQVVLFADLYAVSQGGKFQSKLDHWFNEFSKLEGVSEAVKDASPFLKQERVKPENKGEQKVRKDFLVKDQGNDILPREGERNILVTSALPYVNNVPHLGNIVGSILSADIFARYAKNRNYNTLFICGTDEYGTATETKALEEKVTPRELCDKYHRIHKEVYDWFEVEFDYFGRTTTEFQTEIAQDIFMKLYHNGYLEEKTTEQLYCEEHSSFLADRFVEGTCPKCQYEDARGDQCDKCGTLLNPFELINPRCKLDNSKPVSKESANIYLKLNELQEPLARWFSEASEKGNWSRNSKQITNSWLKQGLEPRGISRDLVWGTPVPLDKFKDKVLYVWFDATIGYVSITANYFKTSQVDNWKKWWRQPENVKLYQFMGKDNVPFHSVVFPASLIGTKEKWTKVHHLSTTEYLQYEGGKFSKSRGIGVFGNNAKATGISPSVWRYYLASVRPESADAHFSWSEFVTKNNSELLANLGNFVNRVLKFLVAKYNSVLPEYSVEDIPKFEEFRYAVDQMLESYINSMESSSIRRALELAMFISSRGNQFLQDNKLDNSLYTGQPARADAVIAVSLNLIYLLSALVYPFMPTTSKQMLSILNAPPLSITDKFELVLEPGHSIGKPQYLFSRIDEKKVNEWRNIYGGPQV